MTVKLSAEREAELLADYKARKTAIEDANKMLDEMRATQRKKQTAFWAKVNTPHIHKLRVAQKCSCCNASLPVGSMAQEKTENVNVSGHGWTGTFLTKYYCLVCSKQINPKVEL
jgi:hypothetical protein